MKNLIQKKSFLVIALVSFSFFQLIYSFLFPAAGFSDIWQPVETYLPKFEIEGQDAGLLNRFLPLISSEYRLNSDAGHYLETGRNFNSEFFKNSPILSRPLYPLMIFLSSFLPGIFSLSSYGIIFGIAIAGNFILLIFGALLFFLILEKIFSLKVAFLSSSLLIFSPFVHASLVQPRADILMLFSIVLSVYLLQNYLKSPSKLKLTFFSLAIGFLMLGKMFYALPFFILLLAAYFKRYKEGSAFAFIQLIPMVLWYLWVTKIWKIPFYAHEIQFYKGDSLLYIFQWPWHKIYGLFLSSLPNFIEVLIYGFLLIPVIFSIIGFQKISIKSKNIIYFGSFFSVFIFSFLVNIYYYRIAFLLFPIIYPTCLLGIEEAANFFKKYKTWYGHVFYAAVIILIILISSVNFYKIFDYL